MNTINFNETLSEDSILIEELQELLGRQNFKYDDECSFENDHNPSIMLWIDPHNLSVKHQMLVLINKIQYTAIMTEEDFNYFLDLVNDEAYDRLPIMYIRKCEYCFEWHLDEVTSQKVYDLISHKFVADKLNGLLDVGMDDDE